MLKRLIDKMFLISQHYFKSLSPDHPNINPTYLTAHNSTKRQPISTENNLNPSLHPQSLTGKESAKWSLHSGGVIDSSSGEGSGCGDGLHKTPRNIAQAQRYHLLRCVETFAFG